MVTPFIFGATVSRRWLDVLYGVEEVFWTRRSLAFLAVGMDYVL